MFIAPSHYLALIHICNVAHLLWMMSYSYLESSRRLSTSALHVHHHLHWWLLWGHLWWSSIALGHHNRLRHVLIASLYHLRWCLHVTLAAHILCCECLMLDLARMSRKMMFLFDSLLRLLRSLDLVTLQVGYLGWGSTCIWHSTCRYIIVLGHDGSCEGLIRYIEMLTLQETFKLLSQKSNRLVI